MAVFLPALANASSGLMACVSIAGILIAVI